MDSLAVGINKLTLKAGDLVAVTLPAHLGNEMYAAMDAIQEALTAVLPHGVKVMILTPGTTLTVLRDGQPVEPEIDVPVTVEVRP